MQPRWIARVSRLVPASAASDSRGSAPPSTTDIDGSCAASTISRSSQRATATVVVSARFADRVGKGIRGAPRDALIADITPEEDRGASYGLRQSLNSVGAFVDPLIAITRLGLLDNGEYQLYSIDLEVSEQHPDLPRDAVLADVRDRAKIESVIAAMAPDLVFHAAALKHVPLVEINPIEAVLTNVIGNVLVPSRIGRHLIGPICVPAGISARVIVCLAHRSLPVSGFAPGLNENGARRAPLMVAE